MEKELVALVKEAKAAKDDKERFNFICRNLWDLLDVFYPVPDTKEYVKAQNRASIKKMIDTLDKLDRLEEGKKDGN